MSINIYIFDSDLFESLAWASAQIHCQCSTNSKVVFSEKINTTVRSAAINASMISKGTHLNEHLYILSSLI